MSHCVNWSTRDLLSGWEEGRTSDIVLLEDCASAVGGFEEVAKTFVNDMRKAGVTVCKAADFYVKIADITKADVDSDSLKRSLSQRGKRFCRQQTGFASKAGAAGLMDGVPFQDNFSGGLALFIIDPQVDFHEGGSLAVTGATEDSKKIAALISRLKDKIE